VTQKEKGLLNVLGRVEGKKEIAHRNRGEKKEIDSPEKKRRSPQTRGAGEGEKKEMASENSKGRALNAVRGGEEGRSARKEKG